MTTAPGLLVRLVSALALGAALAGCNMGSAKPAAEEQVMPFHNRYNARHFQAMYDNADVKLRPLISRDSRRPKRRRRSSSGSAAKARLMGYNVNPPALVTD